MSYGISIIYHKYPLYEAWEIARNMLFTKAKSVSGKNAVAINLRKNSGSDFEMTMSKSTEAYTKLKALINTSLTETLVSSVAHKFRANEALLDILPKDDEFKGLDERMTAFYEKVIDTETKSENESTYLNLTKDMFEIIYKDSITEQKKEHIEENGTDMHIIISQFYSMLRIAKFIKGEDSKDE